MFQFIDEHWIGGTSLTSFKRQKNTFCLGRSKKILSFNYWAVIRRTNVDGGLAYTRLIQARIWPPCWVNGAHFVYDSSFTEKNFSGENNFRRFFLSGKYSCREIRWIKLSERIKSRKDIINDQHGNYSIHLNSLGKLK